MCFLRIYIALLSYRASGYRSFPYPCVCQDITCIPDTPGRVHVFAGEGLDLPVLHQSLPSDAGRRVGGTDNWSATVSHRWLYEGRVSRPSNDCDYSGDTGYHLFRGSVVL